MMRFIILLTLIAFSNISQCQSLENPETPAICFLPELAGNRGRACKAYMPMYRYDSTSKLCVKFIYGGCHGTENRFVTLKECVDFCGAGNTFIPSIRCSGFPIWRQCNSTTASYFFDTLSEICRDRDVGWCTENSNNFNSLVDCNRECVSP